MPDVRKLAMLTLVAVVSAQTAATAAAPPVQSAITAQPDAEHHRLSIFAGEWTVKQSLWPKPGQPPQVDPGHARIAWILNGRHLQQSVHIDGATAFDGLSYFGYDDAAAKYFITWMDINFNGIIVAQGAYDRARRSYTLLGSMNAPGGQTVPVREVLTVRDDDHFSYEFFETRGGKEALGVRLDYVRE